MRKRVKKIIYIYRDIRYISVGGNKLIITRTNFDKPYLRLFKKLLDLPTCISVVLTWFVLCICPYKLA